MRLVRLRLNAPLDANGVFSYEECVMMDGRVRFLLKAVD